MNTYLNMMNRVAMATLTRLRTEPEPEPDNDPDGSELPERVTW